MPKGSACPYCQNHGLDAYWWDRGMSGHVPVRHVIPEGVRGKIHPAWVGIRRYRCDRCGLPADLLPAPMLAITEKP